MGWLNAISAEARASTVNPVHPRDPALAELFGTFARTAAGISITPENARECPEVDACIGLNEDTIATVPLDLFKRGKDGTGERQPAHPLHRLLHDAPNEHQTSAEFRQQMEGWRETHGRAYAWINWRGDGVPESLEPRHPLEMRCFRAEGGRIAYRWTPPDGPPSTYLAHEILHLKDKPFRRDGLDGTSRVERHREAIGRAQATGEYLSRFFSNNAVPKTFLKPTAGTLDKEQMDAVLQRLEERHSGPHNAHRIGVLNTGFDLVRLGATNEEAEVVSAYEMAVAQIARAWGVPLHLIGETSKTTSWGTGIEQQSIGFIVYYMRPKFVVWEQALNRALMSSEMRQDHYFEFNVDGLLRGDFKTRMEGFALMIQWGLASVNEIRRKMNLPPVEGGNERLHPLNMAPASRIMDVLLRERGDKTTRDMADEVTRLLAAMVAGQRLAA